MSVLGKKRRLVVRSWDSLATVKGTLAARLHIPTAHQRLFFRGKELKNTYSLQDAGVCRSGELLTLSIAPQQGLSTTAVCIEALNCPRALQHALWQAKRSFLLGKAPQLAVDGTGGCYFFPDPRGVTVAVFKPSDEEAFCACNPRGPAYCTEGGWMRAGVTPGQSYLREIAAYRLDTAHFAGIPTTGLVQCSHPKLNYQDHSNKPSLKLGSLQAFVTASAGPAEDFSPSRFSVAEVHKIAILDMRILNCDRNAGNLLVVAKAECEQAFSLVPIDHGLSFPEALSIGFLDWCWLDWPQSKEPLDEETQSFVLDVMDPEADYHLVLKFGLSLKSAVLVKLSGLLLQMGCRSKLSLHTIARLIARDDFDGMDHPSPLELVHAQATALASEKQLDEKSTGAESGDAHRATPHLQSPSPERKGFWVHDITKVENQAIEAGVTVWDENGTRGIQKSSEQSGTDITDSGFDAAFWGHAERLLNDLIHTAQSNCK